MFEADSLDVLLIESAPGAGADEAEDLRAAGHRVHSCAAPYRTPAATPYDDSLPVCVAVTEGTCPIDEGIDVALLCRHPLAGRPRLAEAGVLCALRQDIPLVVDAPESADGFREWASRFVHGDVVQACLAAVDDGFTDLRADVARRISLILASEHVEPDDVTCRFETEGPRLVITVVGPELERSVQQAIGVRVLDAVRAAPHIYGQVNVTFEVAAPG